MRPSVEATTSCGSGPDGTRPRTLSVVGSTVDSVRSPFESTSSALDGVDIALRRERSRRGNPGKRQQEGSFHDVRV